MVLKWFIMLEMKINWWIFLLPFNKYTQYVNRKQVPFFHCCSGVLDYYYFLMDQTKICCVNSARNYKRLQTFMKNEKKDNYNPQFKIESKSEILVILFLWKT